jgi:hypothetical protein
MRYGFQMMGEGTINAKKANQSPKNSGQKT